MFVGQGTATAATSWTLTGPTASSPTATVTLDDSGALALVVRKGTTTVINSSPLGIRTNAGDLSKGLTFVSRTDKVVPVSYTMVTGKQRTRSTTFNETTLSLNGSGGAKLNLVVRVSADGVSYRYVLPATGTVNVTGEASSWNIPANSPAWLADFTLDDQGQWRETTSTGAGSDDFTYPALFDVGGVFVHLAESDLDGRYTQSTLQHSAGSGRYNVSLDGNVSSPGPLSTAWRTAAIGDLKTVTESKLVDDLAAPSKVSDTSWIKPGNVAWSWLTDGVDSVAQQKQYIDFAQRNGWSAVLVDEGFADSWIPELVTYGKARGVGIIPWYNSDKLQTQAARDTILNKVKNWGCVGLKIDYVFDDKQSTLKWYDQILKQTADLKLMVNFHGAVTPRGRQRTWPHVMTAEGVFGAEQKQNKAVFDTILPYTRNAISSMDFTPVTFSMTNRDTTNGHELGMAVAFESAWQHYGDNPGSYDKYYDAMRILNRTPTTWDETRLLAGRPGQEAWFARRRGDNWTVGGISAVSAKTFSTPLSFLGSGQWFTEVVTDSTGGNLTRTTKQVTSADTLSVPIATRGGFGAIFCRYTAGMTGCPRLS
jgi:alpha-glucosidase